MRLKDTALRFIQSLPRFKNDDCEIPVTTFRDHFCNPQPQDLQGLRCENLKILSKTDILEDYFVTLQTKTMKIYPDRIYPAVAPNIAHALDAAAERIRFDQDTACRAEVLRSAQESRSLQVSCHFVKLMPGWLRARLLEQPENAPVEDSNIFARKQLNSCHFMSYVKQITEWWLLLLKRVLQYHIHLLRPRQNRPQFKKHWMIDWTERLIKWRAKRFVNEFFDNFSKKNKQNSPIGALFCKTVVKTQIF